MWRHSPEIQNMIMFSLERIFLEEDLKFEIEFQKLDGEIRDLEFTIKPLHNEKGEIDKLFALGYDTTIVKKTAYNLKRTERELSLFFKFSNEGYLINHLEKPIFVDENKRHEQAQYVLENLKTFMYNDALLKIFSVEQEELSPLVFSNKLNLSIDDRLSIINIILQNKIIEEIIAYNSSYYHTSIVPVQENGVFNGYFIIMRDITEQKNYQDQLYEIATKDPLTGAKNRRSFMEIVEEKLAKINGEYASVLAIIDIDKFKNFNDTYGHDVGDDVLIALTKCAEDYFKDIGTFARLGGEEFVFFIPKNREGIFQVIEGFREAIAAIRIKYSDKDLSLTVSIGATTITASDKISKRMKRADENLYEAKESGKNCTVFKK